MRLKICLHSRRKNTASSSWSVSKWKKIKWFTPARKSVFICKNKVIFQKLDSPVPANRKKPQNKIILFQVDNIVSTSGNEEFV